MARRSRKRGPPLGGDRGHRQPLVLAPCWAAPVQRGAALDLATRAVTQWRGDRRPGRDHGLAAAPFLPPAGVPGATRGSGHPEERPRCQVGLSCGLAGGQRVIGTDGREMHTWELPWGQEPQVAPVLVVPLTQCPPPALFQHNLREAGAGFGHGGVQGLPSSVLMVRGSPSTAGSLSHPHGWAGCHLPRLTPLGTPGRAVQGVPLGWKTRMWHQCKKCGVTQQHAPSTPVAPRGHWGCPMVTEPAW